MRRKRGSVGRRKGREGLYIRWSDRHGVRRLKRAESEDPDEATDELRQILKREAEEEQEAIHPSDIKFEEGTLKGAIGSTAQGVGRATARKILRGALRPKPLLAGAVRELRPYITDTLSLHACRTGRSRSVASGPPGARHR